jgi:hypothetical protein
MTSQRIQAIRGELLRTAKSLFSTMIALGGGLIPFACSYFGWLNITYPTTISLLIILLIFLTILTWNLSRYAEERLWHDRKYQQIAIKWNYPLGADNNVLRATCEGERHFTCLLGAIAHTTISVGPTENYFEFNPDADYQLSLPETHRSESGCITLGAPHRKSGASFAFRVHFNPPLREGEVARIKYKFTLPKFKIATIEHLREKSLHSALGVRDYEYNSYAILYPTDEFIYELNFCSECHVKPRAIKAVRGTETDTQEEKFINNMRSFICEEINDGWKFKLIRKRPPINIRYYIEWTPPAALKLNIESGGNPA